MKHLRLYDSIDIDWDDFDYDESIPFDWDSFLVEDLWYKYENIDRCIKLLNENLINKIVQVYDTKHKREILNARVELFVNRNYTNDSSIKEDINRKLINITFFRLKTVSGKDESIYFYDKIKLQ